MVEPLAPKAPLPDTAAVSPLAEAKYDSLEEFLSRDPFQFQRQDRAEIVRILRAQRTTWEAQGAKGKLAAHPKAGGTTPKDEVSIKDLGL